MKALVEAAGGMVARNTRREGCGSEIEPGTRGTREKVKLIFVRAWVFAGLLFSLPSAPPPTNLPPWLRSPASLVFWKVSSAYLAGSWYPWYVNPANRWLYEIVPGDRSCLGSGRYSTVKRISSLSLSSWEKRYLSSLPAIYIGKAVGWYHSFASLSSEFFTHLFRALLRFIVI